MKVCVDDGKWHLIVSTTDGKVYVDGAAVDFPEIVPWPGCSFWSRMSNGRWETAPFSALNHGVKGIMP